MSHCREISRPNPRGPGAGSAKSQIFNLPQVQLVRYQSQRHAPHGCAIAPALGSDAASECGSIGIAAAISSSIHPYRHSVM
jgi:hypothetical protein